MRVVILSDTHDMIRGLDVPEGDILIHCGDFTNGGHYMEIDDFNYWLGEQPHPYKIVVPGNHDKGSSLLSDEILYGLSNAIVLWDNLITINGLRLYGSPWCPVFDGVDSELMEKFDKIPENIDILITHAPPRGILDMNYWGDCIGSYALRVNVFRAKPRYHVFGHAHQEGGKIEEYRGITFINAALLDEKYERVREPWIIDIEVKE